MGALSPLLWWALLGAAPARAQDADAELRLVPVDGAPRPGDLVTIEVAASRDGQPVVTTELPQVRLDGGELLGAPRLTAPGRWQALFRAPAVAGPGQSVAARVSLGELEQAVALPVAAPARSSLVVPPRLEVPAGRDAPVRIPLTASEGLQPDQVQVAVGEGVITEVSAGPSGPLLTWRPLEDPMPRAVPLLVRDGRQPLQPPAVGVLRMVGRPRVPIETDPGAEVRLEIGERSYGPFVADEQGVALTTAEILPGETSAVVIASDALGNERRTTIALGGRPGPSLLMQAESALVPGQALPDIHVLALRSDGRPWTGDAPTCRTAVGAPLTVVPTEPGLWRALLPPGVDALFDLRIECTLAAQVRSTLQVPVEAGVPAAVRLRVWPPELDADLPAAQVQAWLEGPLGDRLPADGIVLAAERGALQLETGSPAVVVAAYDGTEAVAAGQDRISAQWTPPPGEGGAWSVDVGLAGPPASGGALPVAVQARDRLGRPLEAVRVTVGVEGASAEAITDVHGQATVTVPVAAGPGPWVVQARAGTVEHRGIVFADDASDQALRPGAELSATVDLALRTGTVRRISVSASPDRLAAGGAQGARIMVSLQDQAGQAITDQVPVISASAGSVGRVRLTDEGSFEADYSPPVRMAYGTVDVAVAGPEGGWSAHTRIDLEPRNLRHAVGLHGGWIAGGAGISSPAVVVEYEAQLPLVPTGFLGRVAATVYGTQRTIADEQTAEEIDLDLTFLPLTLGVRGRRELGRVALFGGAGLAVTPFRQVATYGDRVATRSPGLAVPGPEFDVGAGLRLGTTELCLDLSYLYISVPPGDVGLEGLVGGLRPTLGWKLLF